MSKSRRVVNGYVLLFRPEHFNCLKGDNWQGYVYEHRFIMEQSLGRALEENEIVHHIDCNKLNNSISNLILISRSDHMKLHNWIDNGAVIYESYEQNGVNSKKANLEVKLCIICEGTLTKYQKKTCSKECHNEYQRTKLTKVVNRPGYSQLLEDLQSMSMVKVGNKYGVSDNAIRKWIKRYKSSMPTLSQAESTLSEGAETSGEVKSS